MHKDKNDQFVEEFFDSNLYKEILARNDKKRRYIVKTADDKVFALDGNINECVELHFPEEIEEAIRTINE